MLFCVLQIHAQAITIDRKRLCLKWWLGTKRDNDFMYSEHHFKNGLIHKHDLNLHKLPKPLHQCTH